MSRTKNEFIFFIIISYKKLYCWYAIIRFQCLHNDRKCEKAWNLSWNLSLINFRLEIKLILRETKINIERTRIEIEKLKFRKFILIFRKANFKLRKYKLQ